MKHGKRRPARKRGTAKKAQPEPSGGHREIPDPLVKEVEETNEHIADPKERERVIPSRPC